MKTPSYRPADVDGRNAAGVGWFARCRAERLASAAANLHPEADSWDRGYLAGKEDAYREVLQAIVGRRQATASHFVGLLPQGSQFRRDAARLAEAEAGS